MQATCAPPAIQDDNQAGRTFFPRAFPARIADLIAGPIGQTLRSSLGRRVFGGAFWSLISGVAGRITGIASSIIAARLLGVKGFGELGIIQTTVATFAVFAAAGMGLTVTKYVAERASRDPGGAARVYVLCTGFSIVVGGLIAGIMVAFAQGIARYALAAPEIAPVIPVAALLLVLEAVHGVQIGALNGLEAFRPIASLNTWVGIFSVPAVFLGVSRFGVVGGVWALTLIRGFALALSQFYIRRELRKLGGTLTLSGLLAELAPLARFAAPSALSSVVLVSSTWLCNALLVHQPNGYTELGLFNAASQWRSVIYFLPYTVSGVCLPIATSLYATGRYKEYWSLLRNGLIVNILLSAVLAVVSVAGSTRILAAYGPGFRSGTQPLCILAFSCIALSVDYITFQALISQGRVVSTLVSSLLLTGTMLALAAVLLHGGRGATGLAASVGLAYVLKAGFQVFLLARSRNEIGGSSLCLMA